MIEHRQLLNSIWEKGTLHKELGIQKRPRQRPRREPNAVVLDRASPIPSPPPELHRRFRTTEPFSMEGEIDMDLSDGELAADVSNGHDLHDDSRYNIGTHHRQTSRSGQELHDNADYFTADESLSGSEWGDSYLSASPRRVKKSRDGQSAKERRTHDHTKELRPTPPPNGSSVKRRRNRDYWGAKGG